MSYGMWHKMLNSKVVRRYNESDTIAVGKGCLITHIKISFYHIYVFFAYLQGIFGGPWCFVSHLLCKYLQWVDLFVFVLVFYTGSMRTSGFLFTCIRIMLFAPPVFYKHCLFRLMKYTSDIFTLLGAPYHRTILLRRS